VFQIVSGVHFIFLHCRTAPVGEHFKAYRKVKGQGNGYLPLQFLINVVI